MRLRGLKCDVAAGTHKLLEYVLILLHIPELVVINIYNYIAFR